MVLPLIGSLLAPTLFAGAGGLSAATLAGLGAGVGSLAQGDDLGEALSTGLVSGLTAGIAGKLLGGAGSGAGQTAAGELGTTAAGNVTGTAGSAAGQGTELLKAMGMPDATAQGLSGLPSPSATQVTEGLLPRMRPGTGLPGAGEFIRPETSLFNPTFTKETLLAGATGGLGAMASQPMEQKPAKKRREFADPGVASPPPPPTGVGRGVTIDTPGIRSGVERDFGFGPAQISDVTLPEKLKLSSGGIVSLAEGGNLKEVPDDNPGLAKLPEEVRNKMGYMEEGGIVSMAPKLAEAMGAKEDPNDKEIITGAVRAIAGMSEQPEIDLARFISRYGEDALEDLVDRVKRGDFFENMVQNDGLMKGAGDGMDDLIPASLEDGKQDVVLSNDEFVVPADVVSGLGNGSSDAGAKALYDMMERVRMKRTGTTEQPPQVPQEEMLPV
tara:strand:+ start:3522 stop:4844 length:1323 start_codon:yes stop_codon:yes gene_type:complete